MRIEGLPPAVGAVHREVSPYVAARPADGVPCGRAPASAPASAHDAASFAAGQACGARIAACVARLAALELLEGSRWWNRRRHRLMARALVACAEEMERTADAASAPERHDAPALSTAGDREPT